MKKTVKDDTEKKLDALDAERVKFTQADKTKMAKMVEDLVASGIYPKQTKIGTPLSMVENYGARWHTWREPHFCPKCKADWRDHKNGPPFRTVIGIYGLREDRTVEWMCPACKSRFDRDAMDAETVRSAGLGGCLRAGPLASARRRSPRGRGRG